MLIFTRKLEKDGTDVIEGNWGYAIVKDDMIYIPAVVAEHQLSIIMLMLYKMTNLTRMKFTAIIWPEEFKTHLHNIVSEGYEYNKYYGEDVYYIEIKYKPLGDKV